MTIIFIAAILICLLLLLVLYRNLPNKKTFYAFCATLLIAISAISYSFLSEESAPQPANESTIRHITAQQQIFDVWYTDYKKQIDQLDYNWSQAQMILADYQNDEISINTLYTRLNLLEHQAQLSSEALKKLTPPISLDDTNYELSSRLLQKTQVYADRQYETISELKYISSPGNLMVETHEEQSRLLSETMLRKAPEALFTAAETSSLRTRLTIPEN